MSTSPSTPKNTLLSTTPPPAPRRERGAPPLNMPSGPLPVELFPSTSEVLTQRDWAKIRWKQDFKRSLYNTSTEEAQKMIRFLYGGWMYDYEPAMDYLEPLSEYYWSYDCITDEERESFHEIKMAYQRNLRRLSARRILFLDMAVDHKVGIFGLNDQIISFLK